MERDWLYTLVSLFLLFESPSINDFNYLCMFVEFSAKTNKDII